LGGVSAREFYLAETQSYNCEKLGINSKGNRVFLANKFLIQSARVKIELKNYRDDHHEFREFL
jgi:hypothetical protein